jgi:signal transduction histidine kinase
LFAILNEQYMADWLDVALNLASRDQYYDLSSGAIRLRFVAYINQTQHFRELLLLDPQGKVIVSSGETEEGTGWRFFADSLQAGSSTAYSYLSTPQPDFIINSVPVVGEDTRINGYIAGISNLDDLRFILEGDQSTDRTGKAYLVTQDRRSLPDGRAVASPGIEAALDSRSAVIGVMDDFRGERVLGVYQWFPELTAALVVEQDFSEALGGMAITLGGNLLLALAALIFAGAASQFIVRNIGLEARVDEHTQALGEANRALEQRALQLETSASLSREITSILQIDALMKRVTQLIKESFDYYHVEIFLLDEDDQHLWLGASSGTVETHFLKLPLNEKSLNGTAILTCQPVLANDAESDPRFLSDSNLPETRAELVVPLQIGERVIGTLDVQSATVNSFSRDDVLVLQSLADQIAIAIENARLYDRSRELATMEERNRLARDLHDSVTQTLYSLSLLSEGWRQLIRDGQEPRVEERLGKVSEIASQALKEMRLLIHQLRPPALEKDGLIGALRQRLDAVEYRAGVEARLVLDDLIILPPSIEEGFYYIAQEALNNALKHASATNVTVGLDIHDDHAILTVTDNGRGFDLVEAGQHGGLGLRSMRERVQQLNGTLELATAPGQGTSLTVRVKMDGRS